MTREQLARAIDLAEAGLAHTAIGRQLGVHPEAVRGAFRERGIMVKRAEPSPRPKPKPKRRGLPAEDRRPWTWFDDQRLRDLFAARRTDTEIAQALGRSRHDVRARRAALRLRRGFGA